MFLIFIMKCMQQQQQKNKGNIYSGTFPKIPTKKRVYSMCVCLSNFSSSSSSPSTFLSYNRRETESLLKKEEEEKIYNSITIDGSRSSSSILCWLMEII